MSDPTQPDAPSFDNRDPNSPGFWNERFDQHFMPWDQAGVPETFEAFVATRTKQNVLIPGCGSAYEARHLAERGWPVRAIDFAPAAVVAARAQLGAHAGIVEEADFFTYQPPFSPDWIYERAFLCALPRDRWQDYARQMAALLAPGAVLAGFFFIGATPKGPPFGIGRDELDALLTPHFELIEDREVSHSIPVFADRERWMTWRRK
ncbi:thiopurine S-methyltransferase family protein [Caballeronia hypogeia]|uniref:Thiopurine S-methyltransferase family protein n=1 Tax=Caballeronia hypogeia TaxID=1777140 RepID=A0A157Z528_9BURK|nr:methyltransferase [Caballeronia hypogeia]SAK40117.1 thiopurine S-methyltransferase family protein [Caballeronia hypogeia]